MYYSNARKTAKISLFFLHIVYVGSKQKKEEEKTLKKKYKINLHILEACSFRCLQGCGALRVDSEVCAGMPD